ncbi:hypothetical protein Hte_006970 [Hypoxylon texense]
MASGTALKWVGDQSLVDFISPGRQVAMERHDELGERKFMPLTGSSVATALASGLAAILLYCVQLAGTLRYLGHPDEFRFYELLKNHERMKGAFKKIGTTTETKHHDEEGVWTYC